MPSDLAFDIKITSFLKIPKFQNSQFERPNFPWDSLPWTIKEIFL